jgi:hypothetical protein
LGAPKGHPVIRRALELTRDWTLGMVEIGNSTISGGPYHMGTYFMAQAIKQVYNITHFDRQELLCKGVFLLAETFVEDDLPLTRSRSDGCDVGFADLSGVLYGYSRIKKLNSMSQSCYRHVGRYRMPDHVQESKNKTSNIPIDFQWDILPKDGYPQVIVASEDELLAGKRLGVTFRYSFTGRLSDKKKLAISLHHSDCTTDAGSQGTMEIVTQVNELQVDIGFDVDSIAESSLYTASNVDADVNPGAISLCLRVDYELQGESINFHVAPFSFPFKLLK